MIHEDNRRVLVDWACDKAKTIKTVIAKQDCELGKHYHKLKTEKFMLVSGSAVCIIEKDPPFFMEPFKEVVINPGVTHTFQLFEDSVLLCQVDKKYNPDDDYECSGNSRKQAKR